MNNGSMTLNRFIFLTQGVLAGLWMLFVLGQQHFIAYKWYVVALLILVTIGAGYFIRRRLLSYVEQVVGLKRDLRRIADVVSELALESQYLLESSSSQSDAIQRSAASVEETSSMAEQTATQANESKIIVSEINSTSQEGVRIMQELNESIDSINQIRSQIEQIQKIFEKVTEKTIVIDEIVFNTRLLSFNASIEAERAGSQGAGFAVVAQEIGKLANNSGNAAREIREILKDSGDKVKAIVTETKDKVTRGIDVTSKATTNFNRIANSITEVARHIDGISSATREQNIGIKQISEAMSKMDFASQENVKVAQSTESLTIRTEEALADLDHSIRTLGGVIHCSFENRISSFAKSDEALFIAWDEIYSVGLKTIDDQHKILIDIINKLYRAIRGGRTSSLNDIFQELLGYTDKHFSFENDLFMRLNYQLKDEHMDLHRRLVKAAYEMKDRFLSGNLSSRELMDFLRNWLMNHIMKEDVKYVETLKNGGIT